MTLDNFLATAPTSNKLEDFANHFEKNGDQLGIPKEKSKVD